MQNVSKKRVNRMSHSASLRRSINIYHMEHKMVQLYHGYILHSQCFPTTPRTPKSKLKRRSYGLDNLDKENCSDRESSIATKFSIATKKLCHDRENSIMHDKENSVATKFSVMTDKNLCQQSFLS